MRHAPSLQVKTPAAPPEPPMLAAATRLASAIADVLEADEREGSDAPREMLRLLAGWALRQRCIITCLNCGRAALAPDSGPNLCPGCAPLLRPASTRKEAS